MAVRDSRSIEKSLFSPGSRKFFRLKTDQTRLLFIGLVLNADDFGRLEGECDDLAAMFPKMKITETEMAAHVKDMAQNDLITQYKIKNEKYIEINSFVEHQEWHGITSKGSKIPSNPATLSSASRGDRIAPNAVIAEFPEKSAIPPKEVGLPLPIRNLSKPSLDAAANENAREAFMSAKRAWRSKVGKSFGSLGGKAFVWEKAIQEHGSEIMVEAVRMCGADMGIGGRSLGWPYAYFAAHLDEYVDAAKTEILEEKKQKCDDDLADAAIASDKEKIEKENAELAERELVITNDPYRGQI